MKGSSALRLCLLAALWGASFLLIRVAVSGDAPLAPAALMFGRVVVAALFLLLVTGVPRGGRQRLQHYVLVGVINSALPFVLIGWAAKTLGVSICSILNATSPAFGAILFALVAREAPPPRVGVGLALGLGGVVLTAGAAFVGLAEGTTRSVLLLSVTACVAAAFSYGAAAVYARRVKLDVTPRETATGSMLGASLALAGPALAGPLPASATLPMILGVLTLGVACTGVAYVLYFRILQDEGPTAALSVTLLVPLFATGWGALLLGEGLTLRAVLGGLAVLLGTAIANAPQALVARLAFSTRRE